MTRLINADDIKYTDMLAPMGNGNYEHVGIVTEPEIDAMPTVEPTLYGYKIEHLALIARVMQEDGVAPEEAVQIFKDVQTIVLKIIDEIDDAVKRAFEQAMETGNGEDNEQTDK